MPADPVVYELSLESLSARLRTARVDWFPKILPVGDVEAAT
jgi:hypothetical protein